MEPGTLRQGVGEGLGEGGQGVDIQRGIEAVHTAADPAGEGDFLFHPQFPGQVPQLLPLLAVTGNDQPQPGTGLVALGKAPDQGGHILDGVQPGGNAHHHAVFVHIGPQAPEVGQPIPLGRGGGKVDAVVDGVEPVGGEAPINEQVHHGVGHADAVVQMPERPGIDGPEGEPGEGAAHVVQAVVAVDGGHHRQSRDLAEHGADHVGPGAMAVDDLVAALPDIGRQLPPGAEDVVAPADHGGNAHPPGFLGKGTLPEAHKLGGNGLVQMLQQAQHMGFCAAGVSAADEMDDFLANVMPDMDGKQVTEQGKKILHTCLQVLKLRQKDERLTPEQSSLLADIEQLN